MNYENIEELFPLKKAKELLEVNGNKYTLEEARIIRDFLLMMTKIHLPQLEQTGAE